MLNIAAIKKVIPHRDEMLLIDEITEINPLVSAKGIKHVGAEDFYFKGHFPNYPVMPGVLIVEALAQVGAVALMSDASHQGKLAVLTGLDNIKIRGQVKPGDTLVLETNIIKLRSMFGIGEGRAYVNGKLVLSGQISFGIIDK